jgi:hypothetical protein
VFCIDMFHIFTADTGERDWYVVCCDNINSHKASGPDNISGRILNDLQNFTAPILTIIFQKSPQTGCIPTDWKHANVAPAYKKGEKYNAANYRPISLTCLAKSMIMRSV